MAIVDVVEEGGGRSGQAVSNEADSPVIDRDLISAIG